MAVCIPSLMDIYRASLPATSECLVFLTGFIFIFITPMQGAMYRLARLKMRQPSLKLKSSKVKWPIQVPFNLSHASVQSFLITSNSQGTHISAYAPAPNTATHTW